MYLREILKTSSAEEAGHILIVLNARRALSRLSHQPSPSPAWTQQQAKFSGNSSVLLSLTSSGHQ